MIDDLWNWKAVLRGGVTLQERVLRTIGAVPGELVESLVLEHTMTKASVTVRMDTGIGHILLPGADRVDVMPAVHEAATEPKVPMFFRRRSKTFRPGLPDEPRVEFRAIGYVVFRDGRPWHIAALRIFEDRVENHFFADWPESTAQHTASRATLIGGA